MFRIYDFAIKLALLTGFTYGLWLIVGNMILSLFKDIFRVRKIMKSMRSTKAEISNNKVINQIARMINVIYRTDKNNGTIIFFIISISLFVLSFTLLINTSSFITAILLSAVFGLLPYFYLWVRLRSIRIESSYEGETLITVLTNNYKQSYFNMIEAVDVTSGSKGIGAFSRNHLFKLALILKSFRTEDELDEAIRNFVFAYDTGWAVNLGMNIKIAVLRGTNVCVSLDDIINDLKDAREQIENNRRYNSETFGMIKFLLVPLYLFTVYMAINVFGFTIEKFLKYQFTNPIGAKFAILTFSSIVICFVVLILAQKPKFDL